jgi:hypothetical protein
MRECMRECMRGVYEILFSYLMLHPLVYTIHVREGLWWLGEQVQKVADSSQ